MELLLTLVMLFIGFLITEPFWMFILVAIFIISFIVAYLQTNTSTIKKWTFLAPILPSIGIPIHMLSSIGVLKGFSGMFIIEALKFVAIFSSVLFCGVLYLVGAGILWIQTTLIVKFKKKYKS